MFNFINSFARINPELNSGYTSGDVLFSPIELIVSTGNSDSLLKNSNPIEYVGLTWNVNDAPPVTLMFFDKEPTSFGNVNDVCAVNFEDLKYRIGTVIIASDRYNTINASQTLDITGDALGVMRTNPMLGSIWIAAIITSDYSGDLEGDLQIQVGIAQSSNYN